MPPLRSGEKGGLVKRADSLLAPFIKNFGIEERVRLAEIKKNWEPIFGKPLSYHMAPCTLSNGELLLNVDSPVWLQELKFYKEEILKKLASHGVRTVRFRLGRVSMKENPGVRIQRQKVVSLNAEELSFIEETIARLDDESLRGIVKTTIEKAIKTGKTRIK
jgi:hypothetical protein